MPDEVNSYIQWAADAVNAAAKRGEVFVAGTPPSPEGIERLKDKSNNLMADYVLLRGSITEEQLNREMASYILFLSSSAGENRKEIFLGYLKKGEEFASRQGIDSLTATGNLLLYYTAEGEEDQAPTAIERMLGLDMLNAAITSADQLSRQQ